VKSDQGDNYVRYKAEKSFSDLGERITYNISIGPVSAQRNYRLEGLETTPNSEMVVKGTSSREFLLNDVIFSDAGPIDELISKVRFNEPEAPVLIDLTNGNDVLEAEAPESGQKIVPVVAKNETEIKSPPIAGAPRQNVFDMKQSNFVSMFEGYDDVRKEVLVFENDSLRIGDKNKETIKQFIEQMDGENDILSIVGCSHGKSGINNGNSLLALGRANRVKESLLFGGISHTNIYDEGCWAPEHYEALPPRGVVLTLKRPNSDA